MRGYPESSRQVSGLKTKAERTLLPGKNISILPHSVFPVIEKVQVLP